MEERQPWYKQMIAVPNILGYLRLIMIPIFVWLYLRAGETKAYWQPALVIAVSGLTDFLDGKIARKFHMITNLGKVLDPVADKLTQVSMVVCLALRYPLMIAVFVLFAVKEIVLGIVGLTLLQKKHRRLDGAMWCGKICTFVLYIVMFLLFLLPQIPLAAANVMILVCGALLIYAFLHYLWVYVRLWRGEEVPHTVHTKKGIAN